MNLDSYTKAFFVATVMTFIVLWAFAGIFSVLPSVRRHLPAFPGDTDKPKTAAH